MLSSKHLLKNGRYSIERSVCTGPAGTIYLASDNLRKATVAIIERGDNDGNNDLDSGSLARTQHEGLVRINDDFEDRSCRYSATEPLATTAVRHPTDGAACDALFDRLGSALLALNAVRTDAESTSGVEISPETVVFTADGKLKLLYTGSTGFIAPGPEPTSPFVPLETVWERLDHITQKAIYNSYDEASLAVLESPADSRTDLYSLGAIFYRLLTGKDPVPAVERSIEMLDSNADSLKTPGSLNLAVNAEQSDFIMRMLVVKREGRFGSIEDAIFSLPSIPQVFAVQPETVVPQPDEFPLLEIPTMPVGTHSTSATNGVMPIVLVLEEPVVDVTAAFRPPFVENKKFVELASTRKEVPLVREQKEVFSTFETHDTTSSGASKKPFAIAAGALVVAVTIGWVLFGGSSTRPDLTPAASMTAPQNVVQEAPASVSESQPPAEPNSVAVETDNSPNVDQSAKPKPQIADTKTKPVKDAKPAVKNEAKPAKKLTVDDLIN